MARKGILSKLISNDEPVVQPRESVAQQAPAQEPAAPPPSSEQAQGAANDGSGACAQPEPSAIQTEQDEGAVIAQVLDETSQAEREAAEALEAEGVRMAKASAAAPKPRKQKTPAQFARAARRQRELGRRLLARRTRGFASRLRPVRLNNYLLAAAFERFFPVIERATYLVTRFGEMALGEAPAERIITRMAEMTNEALGDRQRELEGATAHIGEVSVKMGDRFITPEFTQPAYDATVQVRTPQADRALDIFLLSDQLLTEFETLYWNQLRSLADRNDQVLRAKHAVLPLFRFAARATINLNRRMKTHAGANEAERPDAQPEGHEPAASASAQLQGEAPVREPEAALAAQA